MERSRISIPHREVAAFCERNGIRRMAFFGSVLLDDFGPESDLDVLVEFEPGRTPGDAVDLGVVWAILRDDLPPLVRSLEGPPADSGQP